MKGRSISPHIRLSDDVIKHASKELLEGLVVSLDYRKAFDSGSKETILATLNRSNFEPMFAC